MGNDEVQQGGVAIMMSAGQREPWWNGCQLAKGSLQHDSTQSTKTDGVHRQMMRWTRKRMNSTTRCRTLFQAATEMI